MRSATIARSIPRNRPAYVTSCCPVSRSNRRSLPKAPPAAAKPEAKPKPAKPQMMNVERKIELHQIHEPSGKRIRYQKVAPGVGPVENEEITKGYEYEKDRYVILTDEDFDAVPVESSRLIDIVQFVDLEEIDPIYFEKPYYLAPTEAAGVNLDAYLRVAADNLQSHSRAATPSRTRLDNRTPRCSRLFPSTARL